MTRPLRCLVVDDKPLALDILTDYIQNVSSLHLVAAITNPIDALNHIASEAVDLIFLDIQMPQLTGLQFLQALNGRASVILTTAYPEYALEGYEHDVIDYLLKPISFERFYRAVQKAQSRLTVANAPASTLFLFVKTEYRLQRIDLNDILYVEGLQNYLLIHTKTQKVIAKQTISSLEDSLPTDRFVRVHKSYIVALAHISSVERSRISVATPDKTVATLPIGDAYRERFYKTISGS
ncbi:MAG: DNA-binding response regulator [Cytophagales bacterium]|nr:MAG: DNA-binding response regulator [Cytophagales bacterium]